MLCRPFGLSSHSVRSLIFRVKKYIEKRGALPLPNKEVECEVIGKRYNQLYIRYLSGFFVCSKLEHGLFQIITY